MTPRWMNPMLVVLVLALVPVSARAWAFSDFQINGAGTAGGTCQIGTLTPVCVSNSGGQVAGTAIASGTYTLSLTAGPAGLVQATVGTCFPANSTGQIVDAATGDVINFKTVGMLCEAGIPGSQYYYNGAYGIDSGTGQFATAAGGGSLTATFQKGFDAPTFIKLDGTIAF